MLCCKTEIITWLVFITWGFSIYWALTYSKIPILVPWPSIEKTLKLCKCPLKYKVFKKDLYYPLIWLDPCKCSVQVQFPTYSVLLCCQMSRIFGQACRCWIYKITWPGWFRRPGLAPLILSIPWTFRGLLLCLLIFEILSSSPQNLLLAVWFDFGHSKSLFAPMSIH